MSRVYIGEGFFPVGGGDGGGASFLRAISVFYTTLTFRGKIAARRHAHLPSPSHLLCSTPRILIAT